MTEEMSLREAISDVVDHNPQALYDYRDGKVQALGFLLGQVMKATDGRYNTALVQADLREYLDHSAPRTKRKRKTKAK